MTPKTRDKSFRRERARQVRRLTAAQRKAAGEARRLLDEAGKAIKAELAGAPSDYQSWILPQIQKGIEAATADLDTQLAAAGKAGLDDAWRIGQDLVDKSIAAGGIEIAAILPAADARQLIAMSSFMTDKMKDVSAQVVRKVNDQIGLVLIGAQTPNEAVSAVSRIVEGGRGRARTIVRTELGRAFSTAAQERKTLAAEHLPGLQKQWRRSGKVHSRVSHDLADGQIVAVEEPFKVGGIELMYPRDPAAPARHSVNCGCLSLPYMASWEVRQPGRQTFSREELALSPAKRRIADVQVQAFDTWSRRLAERKIKARGEWEPVGELDANVIASLAGRGVEPVSAEIGVSDRVVLHMLRDTKARKKNSLPARVVRKIPTMLDRPKAVLYELRAKTPTLTYVFDVPGESRLGKVSVKIRDTDKRTRHRSHNWVTTGGLVERHTLADEKSYALISGSL